MSEWQPIETAPKDGTPFLAYCPKGVERAGYIEPPGSVKKITIAWNGHPNQDQPRGKRWVCADVEVSVFEGSEYTGSWEEYEWRHCDPTHWMPLPEPPK